MRPRSTRSRSIAKVADGLVDEFSGILSRETIERYISESVDLLAESRSTRSSPCSPTASHASA
ncbi:MAG: hypothetical protein ACRDPZ_08950 [Gaiellaceae bacterium]